MNIYLLTSDAVPVDPSLHGALQGLDVTSLPLPASHQDLVALFEGYASGLVFIPAVWEDLFCVKAAGEIAQPGRLLLPVVYGPVQDLAALAAAFNHGAVAYLLTPTTIDEARLVVDRAVTRFRDFAMQIDEMSRLRACQADTGSHAFTVETLRRDQLLGQAYRDAACGRGPLRDGKVSVLLVSSSPLQQKQLAALLGRVGFRVETAGSMKEGLEHTHTGAFTMVVSDQVLPDGDATHFAGMLRREARERVPHFVVWTSSPEKAAALLRPESGVNDIILKPGPEAGVESVLPTLLAAVYRIVG